MSDQVGAPTTMILNKSNAPVIVYNRFNDKTLVVARCSDPACTDVTKNIVFVSDAPFGEISSSMILNTNGNPLIAHTQLGEDRLYPDLYITECGDPSCSKVEKRAIDVANGHIIGVWITMAMGQDKKPIMSYSYDNYTQGQEALRVAKCLKQACR